MVFTNILNQDFEILLFAYSINHGEVKVVDLAVGEKIPIEIITALVDNKIISGLIMLILKECVYLAICLDIIQISLYL